MRVESCRELIFGLLFMGLFCAVSCEDEKPKKLQIGIKKRADNCRTKSRRGDLLHMQYKVSSKSSKFCDRPIFMN